MDPWFINGEYYGSWYHTHDIDVDLDFINSATHVYISHIHPDHFSRKSLEKLNKNIPVLIHSYASKFLKFNIIFLFSFSVSVNTFINIENINILFYIIFQHVVNDLIFLI